MVCAGVDGGAMVSCSALSSFGIDGGRRVEIKRPAARGAEPPVGRNLCATGRAVHGRRDSSIAGRAATQCAAQLPAWIYEMRSTWTAVP